MHAIVIDRGTGGWRVRSPIARQSDVRCVVLTAAASVQVRAGETWVRVRGSRFLQTDPQPGGSANDYDYANQDPINQFDLDGNMAVGDSGAAGCSFACTAASYAAFERSLVAHHHHHHWWQTALHVTARVTSAVSLGSCFVNPVLCKATSIVSAGFSVADRVANGGSLSRALEGAAIDVATAGLPGGGFIKERAFGKIENVAFGIVRRYPMRYRLRPIGAAAQVANYGRTWAGCRYC